MENEKEKKEFNWSLSLNIVVFVVFIALFLFLYFPTLNLIPLVEGDTISLNYYEVIFGNNGKFDSDLNPLGLASFSLFALSLLLFIPGFIFKNFRLTRKPRDGVVLSNFFNVSSLIFIIISVILYLTISYVYIDIMGLKEVFKSCYVEQSTFIFYIILNVVIILVLLSNLEFEGRKFNTSEITELAMLVALAIVLDKVKIPINVGGGSINISAVPLMIYGFRHGFIKGIIASAIVFGFLTNLIDGYGIACYPFDYFIAFLGYSITGLFYYLLHKPLKDKNIVNLLVSTILSGISMFVIRMFGGCLSSVILWNYSIEDALIFNAVYVGFSALSSTVVCAALTPFLDRMNRKRRTTFLKRLENTNEEELAE